MEVLLRHIGMENLLRREQDSFASSRKRSTKNIELQSAIENAPLSIVNDAVFFHRLMAWLTAASGRGRVEAQIHKKIIGRETLPDIEKIE